MWTKPKPRDCPVDMSSSTTACSTLPKGSISCFSTASVTPGDRLPTYLPQHAARVLPGNLFASFAGERLAAHADATVPFQQHIMGTAHSLLQALCLNPQILCSRMSTLQAETQANV